MGAKTRPRERRGQEGDASGLTRQVHGRLASLIHRMLRLPASWGMGIDAKTSPFGDNLRLIVDCQGFGHGDFWGKESPSGEGKIGQDTAWDTIMAMSQGVQERETRS